MSYFVAMIKNPAHPFATFMIGTFVAQDEVKVTLRNVARVLEMPNQQNGSMGLNFMTDHFFTVDCNADLERAAIIVGRMLDPELDFKTITQIENFYNEVRAKKTGITVPRLDASTLSNQHGRPFK